VINLEGITATIVLLREAELKVAQIYMLCAKRWPEDRLFWESIANDEHQHAAHLATMKELVESSPSDYSPGRPFNAPTIRTLLGYFDSTIRKLKEGTMDASTAANVARDIEHSLLEAKYAELVRTQNPQYLALVEQIERDTFRHRERMTQRVGEPKR
jgi:hypothetical protein